MKRCFYWFLSPNISFLWQAYLYRTKHNLFFLLLSLFLFFFPHKFVWVHSGMGKFWPDPSCPLSVSNADFFNQTRNCYQRKNWAYTYNVTIFLLETKNLFTSYEQQLKALKQELWTQLFFLICNSEKETMYAISMMVHCLPVYCIVFWVVQKKKTC